MALHYAIKVVDGYAAEIREAGLDAEGFCQGVLLKDALRTSTNERMDAQAIDAKRKELGDIGFRREMLLQVVPKEGQDVLPEDITYDDAHRLMTATTSRTVATWRYRPRKAQTAQRS